MKLGTRTGGIIMKDTKVVLLGTGTPNADPDRSGPAVAIVVGEDSYIVDFGPGIVRQAAKASRKGIEGLKPKNLKRAFLTHLHSDHTIGYPDLIFTPWVLERDEPLKVYGPKGLKEMTEHILIHEVYSSAGIEKRSPQWKKYHTSVHTSSYELGEIASKVKPGLLVLYHQLFMLDIQGDDEDLTTKIEERENEILEEIKEKYDGEVISGKDLDIF